jgi:hypothetical protein
VPSASEDHICSLLFLSFCALRYATRSPADLAENACSLCPGTPRPSRQISINLLDITVPFMRLLGTKFVRYTQGYRPYG